MRASGDGCSMAGEAREKVPSRRADEGADVHTEKAAQGMAPGGVGREVGKERRKTGKILLERSEKNFRTAVYAARKLGRYLVVQWPVACCSLINAAHVGSHQAFETRSFSTGELAVLGKHARDDVDKTSTSWVSEEARTMLSSLASNAYKRSIPSSCWRISNSNDTDAQQVFVVF